MRVLLLSLGQHDVERTCMKVYDAVRIEATQRGREGHDGYL